MHAFTPAIPQLSDQQLVHAAKAGDRVALNHLIRRHAPALRRICTRLARESAEIDEILQETLCAITRNIHQFREEAAFTTWAYTLARTHRSRTLRKQDALRRLATAAAQNGGDDPAPALDTSDLREAIELALGTLAALDRKVLLMRDLEGYSAVEVAVATGLTVPAVKTRLHRARVAMRDALAADFRSPRPVAA